MDFSETLVMSDLAYEMASDCDLMDSIRDLLDQEPSASTETK